MNVNAKVTVNGHVAITSFELGSRQSFVRDQFAQRNSLQASSEV
jgi:hypothetical protein